MKTQLLVTAMLLVGSAATAQDSAEKGPERWIPSIAAFEERDKASAPKPGSLLFVGSSSIRLWDLQQSWPNENTINNGFGGSTLADSIHFFDRLFTPYRPKAVILYAGDNDVKKGLSASEVATDFDTLARAISASFPEVPILFIAIKPSTSRWSLWPEMKRANDMISERCAEQKHWYFADISEPMLDASGDPPTPKWFVEDGLHLSPFGYREWVKVINKVLLEAGVVE